MVKKKLLMILLLLVFSTIVFSIHLAGGGGRGPGISDVPPPEPTALWSPVINLHPAEPTVGDEVVVDVCLLSLAPERTRIDLFELMANYTASLKIIDSRTGSVYLSKEFTHEPPGGKEYVSVGENETVGLGYVEFVFTTDGEYVAEVSVAGPNLSVNTVRRVINVRPGTIEKRPEVEKRVGNWVLNVRITPTDIAESDPMTVEATIRYVGPDSFRVMAPQPFIKMIKAVSTDGTDFWGVAIPSIVREVEVYPQFSQSFRFVVGPDADWPHRFVPGMYRVEVCAVGCNPDGNQVDITAVLFMDVKASTAETDTTPSAETTTSDSSSWAVG